MTLCAKHRARESNRSGALTRNSATKLGLVIGGIRRVLLHWEYEENDKLPEKDIPFG